MTLTRARAPIGCMAAQCLVPGRFWPPRTASSSTNGAPPARSSTSLTPTATNARKLVAGLELDYNASFSVRRRVGGVYIRAPRLRRHLPRAGQRNGARAAHRRPGLRRSGGALAGRQLAGVRIDPGHGIDGHLCPGHEDSPDPKPDQLAGRRLSPELVAGRTDDCVLVRSRNQASAIEGQLGTGAGSAASTSSARMASDLRKLSSDGQFAGSPKWSPDGARVVFYELAVADTFRARGLGSQATLESRIVSVDVATGARVEHASGPGLKLSPQFLDSTRIGYLAKSGRPRR